jgi:lysophospholipase
MTGAEIDRRALPPGARESTWVAPDGQAIRRIDIAARGDRPPRGSLLFVPGRGDCYEKYVESLGEWHARGWRVTALDWRGQARSGRAGRDDRTGHVEDFATWVADLGAFWAEWQVKTPAPHVLVAHSMGGHLALRAVVEGKTAPDALVLSAPMLGMRMLGLPHAPLHGFAAAMARLGDPRRPAWPENEKPGYQDERMLLLTHDAARFADEAWWREQRPELRMGSPSWGWLESALASIRLLEQPGQLESVTVPVLLIGTSADELVSYRAIERAAKRLPRGELLSFGSEAAHEVLREVDAVRDVAMAAIDAFLDRVAPQPRRAN